MKTLYCAYCTKVIEQGRAVYCPLCDEPNPRHEDCAELHRGNHGWLKEG